MQVVVYGPMACGKTRNAAALAAHFGLDIVVDDWNPKQHRLTPHALHLSHQPHDGPEARSFNFADLQFDATASAPITNQRPLSKRRYV
jgi:hypothetical protein